MKKLISLVAVMAMLLLVLTGCVNVNFEVSLNKDGSADVAYLYTFDKEALQEMGTSSEDMTKDMEEEANKNGFKIEAYSDDKQEGFKATKHFDNASDVSLAEAFGEDYVKESKGITVEKKGNKTVFSQNDEIDLSSMDETTASIVTMKYVVKLPVKAGDNNATEVSKDGKTLTWTLKAGEINKVEFNAQTGSSVLKIVIIAVAAAVVICAIVMVIVKCSKKDKKEPTDEPIKEEKKEEPVIEEKEEEPVKEEEPAEEEKDKEDKE